MRVRIAVVDGTSSAGSLALEAVGYAVGELFPLGGFAKVDAEGFGSKDAVISSIAFELLGGQFMMVQDQPTKSM